MDPPDQDHATGASVNMHPRDKYERTVCSCHECRVPCLHMPGMLAPGDLDRIAEYVSETTEMALRMVLERMA